LPHCSSICQAILISYEFHHRGTIYELSLKGIFNGKADGERLMERLFNLFMADYIIEIFQSFFSTKPLHVVVVSLTAKVQVACQYPMLASTCDLLT
jgi:hypothetical protein